MSLKLYKLDASPPARAAMMACDVFNVPVELIDVNIIEGEHRGAPYLKKNPTHTVPVLEDGDYTIHDSHAILTYLADAYGKDDSWYPNDLKKRTEVNQKLFFDTGILFPRLRNITYPILIEGGGGPNQKQLDDIEEAYGFVEEFLSKTKYIAGEQMTIADLSAIADVTSLVHILPLNDRRYPKTQAWIEDLAKQPFHQKYNAPGAEILGIMYNDKLKSLKSN